MKLKKFMAVTLILAMFASLSGFVMADRVLTLKIDGKTVTSDVAPMVDGGATLVPLRIVSEKLGATVKWDDAKKTATVETTAHTVVFTVDAKTYTVDGTSKALTNPAKMVKGRVLIPIRAFSEAINAKVGFDKNNFIATVDYFTTMTGTLKVTGSTTVQPLAQLAADNLMKMNKGLSITVAGGGSGAGVKDSIAGTTNIGMSSRDLTADELKTLKATAVADDAIALIVHPSNKVKNLTKDQANKIFLGVIKNWNEVGGDNAPIMVQTRETGSGTRATFEELLLAKKSVVATATPSASSAIIKQAVAKNKYAIGYDSLGFLDSTVKSVTLDSVEANAANVKSAKYGMGRSLYLLTKGKATGTSAMFMDYLRTADAQKNIVIKEGYLGLN